MKNKIILLIIILAIVGISLPIILDNGGKSKENIDDDSLIPISEVRDNLDKDMEYANQKFSNLKLNSVIPIFTSSNELYSFKSTYSPNYMGITDQLQMVDKQVALFKESFGEDFDESLLVDDNYESLDTCIEKMKTNNYQSDYNNMPFLTYCISQPDKDYQYMHIDPGFSDVWMDKGKIYNSSDKNSVTPISNLELVKKYYIGDNTVDFDDRYQLMNGTMSIKEGITFVENYVNDELPYTKGNDVKIVVESVDVLKFTDTEYVLYFNMTREYMDVQYMCIRNGNFLKSFKYSADITAVAICETDSVDFYYGMGHCNEILEKDDDAITKIISLKDFLSSVSDKIAENSVYNVEKIKLIYRLNRDNLEDKEGDANLYWMVSGYNNQDDVCTYIFVNALTGELEYDTD